MGGILTKLSYKQLQIIKHAIFYFMQREHVTKEDLQSEKALLDKINEQIDNMKEKMK